MGSIMLISYITGCLIALGMGLGTKDKEDANIKLYESIIILAIFTALSWIFVGGFIANEFKTIKEKLN